MGTSAGAAEKEETECNIFLWGPPGRALGWLIFLREDHSVFLSNCFQLPLLGTASSSCHSEVVASPQGLHHSYHVSLIHSYF